MILYSLHVRLDVGVGVGEHLFSLECSYLYTTPINKNVYMIIF